MSAHCTLPKKILPRMASDIVIDQCIDRLQSAFNQSEGSNEAQGLLEAIEILETMKTP